MTQTAEKPGAAPPARGAAHERRLRGWALTSVLGGLLLSLFLGALDQTIVATALPKIIGELQGFDRLTWVITAYLLASTAAIPIVSKLSDQFGRKWFVLGGVLVFLAGSVFAGLAADMNQLIFWRAIQGIGAGAVRVQVFTLIADIFPPLERAKWSGLFGGVYGVSNAVGPSAGGWITDALGWRWVFYVNLPIGLIALAAIALWLPKDISVSRPFRGWIDLKRIDVMGALLAPLATVSLMLGLTWGGSTYSWDSAQVLGLFAGAAVLFAAFYFAERRATEPMLPLDLFKNRVLAVAGLLAILFGAAFFSTVVYLPLYLQGVLGFSPTNSGFFITFQTMSIVTGATASGFIIARLGRYRPVAIFAGVLAFAGVFLLGRMTAETTPAELIRNLIMLGIGFGLFYPLLNLAVQNAVPRSRLGVATGTMNYLQTLGQTVGVALAGTLVTGAIAADVASRLSPEIRESVPPAVLSAATNPQVLVNDQYRSSLVDRATGAAVEAALPPAIAQATANLPAGPARDAAAATVTATVTKTVTDQVTASLNGIFDLTRQALAAGIQRGFLASLGIAFLLLTTTLFLRDLPLRAENERGGPLPPS